MLYSVGIIDPSEVVLEHFADLCDAFEVRIISILNRLFSAKLITLSIKHDVQRMTGDEYDKADKIVHELHRQVDGKGIDFLKALIDFLLKQNKELKDIGTIMKSKQESKRFYHVTLY